MLAAMLFVVVSLVAGCEHATGTKTSTLSDQATLVATVTPSTLTYGKTAALATTGGSGTGAVTFSVGSSSGCSISGTTLSITNASSTCSVSATKAGDTNYYPETSASVPVTMVQAKPTLSALANATITYGTLLSGAQLNATAQGVDGKTLAGTFMYTATSSTGVAQTVSIGTELAVDTYTYSAFFTPTDSGNYATAATASATLTVQCGAPVLSSITPTSLWSPKLDNIVSWTLSGGCFKPGDQLSMSFGGVTTGTTTLGPDTPTDHIPGANLISDSNWTPMAVGITDTNAIGPSNTLYQAWLGDQNLGALFADGTWAHAGFDLKTRTATLYHYDATGKEQASCPLTVGGSGTYSIAVDQSTGNISVDGAVMSMALDSFGRCTAVAYAKQDGSDWTVSSEVELNGRHCSVRPYAGLISCTLESQGINATATSTNATDLAKVCGLPRGSVATTIAGRDTMIVLCLNGTATTTTPSLVQVDMATMAIGPVAQLSNFTTMAAMPTSTTGGWPFALNANLGVLAVGSTHDNVLDVFDVSTLKPTGAKTITLPASTYRLADDELNSGFVALVAHEKAPVTTLLKIDPMTGTTKTPASTVNAQILGTLLVSNGTVLGADLTGTTYILDLK